MIISNQFINQCAEDCEAIWIEKEYISRWELLTAYHEIGQRILSDEHYGEYGSQLTKAVSLSIKKSERTVQLAIQFAKMFPTIDALPMGKDVSWNKIIKNYLQGSSDEELPALPREEDLLKVVVDLAPWLIKNYKQTKKGIILFVPYERIEHEILQKSYN